MIGWLDGILNVIWDFVLSILDFLSGQRKRKSIREEIDSRPKDVM